MSAEDTDFDEDAALAEIDLYSEVIIAAAAQERPLTPAELDAALGLRPPAPLEEAQPNRPVM